MQPGRIPGFTRVSSSTKEGNRTAIQGESGGVVVFSFNQEGDLTLPIMKLQFENNPLKKPSINLWKYP